jgi:Ca-activated chloride channel family protein
MRFDSPLVLVVAPLVALIFAGLAWWARRARVRHATRWSEALGRVARRLNRTAWIWLGVTSLLGTVALAGPRWGRQVVTADTQALDLVIVVDLSKSMLAEDVSPSRLGRAQAQIRRLVHDLQGDRIGLIGFAGKSFILSPLTGDGSAVQLLVDALDPDMVSTGGSGLAGALKQGRELLVASERVADRVLVVFTDGEAQDSLPTLVDAAERLRKDGMHLVLVAEGRATPTRIPVRAPSGELIGYQEDVDGSEVRTMRRDDLLTAVADGAQGALVAAALEDQAGAVRDLVQGYKRAPARSAATAHDLPRGWMPLLAGVLVLLVYGFTRRSAALAALLLGVLTPVRLVAQAPRNAADDAWRAGRLAEAADRYLGQARAGAGADTTWYNAGTALLAVQRYPEARDALLRAAKSLDPDVRFRALYNLGLLALRLASVDSVNRDAHLADARTRYREALLLRPADRDSKWNLELAISASPPSSGGGGTPPPTPSGGGGGGEAPPTPSLTRAQAEQILESIAAEERETRVELTRRAGQVRETRRERDW